MSKYRVIEWYKDQLDDLWVEDIETGRHYKVDVTRDGTFDGLPKDGDLDKFFADLVGKTIEIDELRPATYYGNGARIVS